jgi:DNA repair photolyase
MSARYYPILCKTALSKSALPGLDYALNSYRGCEHGCLYCYAPAVLRDRELIEHWGESVGIRRNIADVLRSEVRRSRPGVVGIGTVCDPYQPAEREEELTRRCLEVLSTTGFEACIQTKSDLVLRDLDLIGRDWCEVGVTVITLDRELSRKLEPKTSPPDARLAALEALARRGVRTWVFLGPIIRGINDSPENIREIVREARRIGSYVIYDKLNLRAGVLERLGRALDEKTISALRVGDTAWWRRTRRMIERLCRTEGVRCEPAF